MHSDVTASGRADRHVSRTITRGLLALTIMAMTATAGLVGCNRTDGACWAPGQGGSVGTTGAGGVIVGQGGLGDAPEGPGPQGVEEDGADPCNATEGKLLFCNGNTVCFPKDGAPGAKGCHYVNVRRTEASQAQATEKLVAECAALYPDYSCHPHEITCGTQPVQHPPTLAATYYCNGGVTCVNEKSEVDGCSYSGEEVWADDEEDARWFLAENCEVEMHDRYGNNCDHGGMCCTPGSLTCHRK